MNIKTIAVFLLGGFLFVGVPAYAATILFPTGGGTGWGNIQSNTILLGNGTGRLATTTQGTGGQILALVGGVPSWVATTTFSTGLTYSGGNVTNTGLLSLQHSAGTAVTGAITLATSTTAINNDWGITNSSGTFTFNIPSASATVRGLLTAADYTTFNGKLSTAVTSIGPVGALQIGPAVTLATSSTAYNGLTASTTVTATGNTITFANTLAGILETPGGGTGSSTPLGGILAGNGTGAIKSVTIGTGLSFNGTTLSATGAGGSPNSKWATSTNAFASIYPSGGLTPGNVLVGIGTTTPQWNLTVASSTGPQVGLTDGSLTSNIWTQRNINGNFYLSTSSPTTFATSSVSSLSILGGGISGLVGIGTSSPYKSLSIAGDTVIGAATAGGTLGNLYLPTLAANSVPYIGTNGLFSASASFTWTNSSNLLTATNASTTNLTVATYGNFATRLGVASSSPAFSFSVNTIGSDFYIDSTGKIVGRDTTNGWNGRISPTHSFVLSSGTTTTWTASTTNAASPFLVMPFAGTIQQMRCTTDASFLGVQTQIAGTDLTPAYSVASTTVGKITFTANNTFTVGQKVLANFGTTTTSGATGVSCTYDVTETI